MAGPIISKLLTDFFNEIDQQGDIDLQAVEPINAPGGRPPR